MNQELRVSTSNANVKKMFDNLDVSETTRDDYKRRIHVYLAFLQSNDVTRNSFLEFKRMLGARNDLSISTKNKYLAVARIFTKELVRLGFLPFDITLNIKSFRQSQKHKKDGLSAKEMEALVAKINSLPDTPRNLRLKAMFCLLAFNGLRQCEIVRLDADDINLATGVAYVRGKGMDDKEAVYLPPDTTKIIKRHMTVNKIGSGALFRSMGNRRSERMTTKTVQNEMQGLFRRLDIQKTVHGFRHHFITVLLGKMDVRDARKFSRHRNLEMLIVYDDEIDLKKKADEVFRCFEGLRVS